MGITRNDKMCITPIGSVKMVPFFSFDLKPSPAQNNPQTTEQRLSNGYNMDARVLAYLLFEGAKCLRAISELSARASVL